MSTVRNLSNESLRVISANKGLQIRDGLENEYPDVYTEEVIDALKALSVFNKDQKMLMEKRYARRAQRFRNKERIRFLDPHDCIQNLNLLRKAVFVMLLTLYSPALMAGCLMVKTLLVKSSQCPLITKET